MKLAVAMVSLLSFAAFSCAGMPSGVEAAEESAWEVHDALSERPESTIAVYPFATDDDMVEVGRFYQDELYSQLAAVSAETKAGFKVVSRTFLDRIMQEQSFQLSDIADPAKGSRVGKLAGADFIVSGTIRRLDDQEFHVSAQILEVETGTAVGAFVNDFYYEGRQR